jgi:hypothetical protein
VTDVTDVTLFEDEVVPVSLDLGSHALVKGYRGGFGLPVEAFTRLFAVRDGRPVAQIQVPEDLSRFVREVHTLAQALAFVDLFTTPSTHYLFPSRANVIELTVRTDHHAVRPGAVTPEVYAALGLEPAEAREAEARFEIARNLIARREAGLEARRVYEEVGRDGTYREAASRLVGEVDRTDVVFPVYE